MAKYGFSLDGTNDVGAGGGGIAYGVSGVAGAGGAGMAHGVSGPSFSAGRRSFDNGVVASASKHSNDVSAC